jgi:hypothetical protein
MGSEFVRQETFASKILGPGSNDGGSSERQLKLEILVMALYGLWMKSMSRGPRISGGPDICVEVYAIRVDLQHGEERIS